MFVLPSLQIHHSLSITSWVSTIDNNECLSDKISENQWYFFLLLLIYLGRRFYLERCTLIWISAFNNSWESRAENHFMWYKIHWEPQHGEPGLEGMANKYVPFFFLFFFLSGGGHNFQVHVRIKCLIRTIESSNVESLLCILIMQFLLQISN